MSKRNLLLFGGGLDSAAYFVLMCHFGISFKPLLINYGQLAWRGEWSALEKLTLDLTGTHVSRDSSIYTHSIKDVQKGPTFLLTGNKDHDPYVRGRNFLLIAKALKHGDNIILGLCDPGYKPFPDADEEFIRNVNESVRACFTDAQVLAPFINVSRPTVLAAAASVYPKLFDTAWTCWTVKEASFDQPESAITQCGVCKHCMLAAKQRIEIEKVLLLAKGDAGSSIKRALDINMMNLELALKKELG